MLNANCYVCTDAKKHRMKVDDLNRINRVLIKHISREVFSTKINIRKNEDLRKIIMNLDYDKPRIHFMCGCCRKVTESDLDVAYNRLKDSYVKIVLTLLEMNDEKRFNRTKSELVRLFAGHLPRYARSLNSMKFNQNDK